MIKIRKDFDVFRPFNARDRGPVQAQPPVVASSTIALLHMDEAPYGSRPLTWINSVSGGPIFNNWGTDKVPGTQSLDGTPFGQGSRAQTDEGGCCAVTSDSLITVEDDFCFESFISSLDQDRNLMQFGTNGSDSGAMKITVTCRKDGNDDTWRMHGTVRFNGDAFEAFYTPPLAGMTMNGEPDWYHFALQREAGFLTFRANGIKTSVAPQAINGPLTGYLDLFGSFDRTWNGADGMFGSRLVELRASRKAIYTGDTYAVPLERFAL